jgi:hypothetical protein
MRLKTSITSWSRVIGEALRDPLERRRRERRDARDLVILNRNAEGLNREVEDVLAYQWLRNG